VRLRSEIGRVEVPFGYYYTSSKSYIWYFKTTFLVKSGNPAITGQSRQCGTNGNSNPYTANATSFIWNRPNYGRRVLAALYNNLSRPVTILLLGWFVGLKNW